MSVGVTAGNEIWKQEKVNAMKIVISGYMGKKITGIGRNLINLLENATGGTQFVIYTNADMKDDFVFQNPNMTVKTYGVSKNDSMKNLLRTTFVFPFVVLKEKANRALILNFTLLLLKFKPTFVIMHDLIEFNVPDKFSKKKMFYRTKLADPIAARMANRIITVSENSKRDIMKFFGVQSQKIEVIYNGVDQEKFKRMDKGQANDFRKSEATLNLRERIGQARRFHFGKAHNEMRVTMMKKHILVVDTHNMPWKMLEGIDYRYPVDILQNERFPKSKFLQLIKRVHLSSRINNIINLPFKHIWSMAFRHFQWEDDTEYIVLFGANTMSPLSCRFLNRLKREHNIKYVLFLSDSLNSATSRNYYVGKYLKVVSFDKVLSFDFEDVRINKDFAFYLVPYKILPALINQQLRYDIAWFGTPAARLEMLRQVHNYLVGRGVRVRYEMRMSKMPDGFDSAGDSTMIFKEKRPYSDIITLNGLSNCILEIPIPGQTGCTYRYYEAICYNKKLLTTNPNVVNMPFYDQRYIRIFEKPGDIDIDWLLARDPVDYGYDGRFSPENFLDGILNMLEVGN